MMSLFSSLRRAPVRLGASVIAMALAVAAIGVFAVPNVAASTLRELAEEEQLPHIELAVSGQVQHIALSDGISVETAPDSATNTTEILVRHSEPTEANLNAAVEELRRQLGPESVFLEFPQVTPGGRHPIEDDLVQISTMIGLLGVVAGVVALVLLATTTSTLITEHTKEVAVMRALGGRKGPLRRSLRRLGLGVAGLGLAIGIPLGLVVANVVARMVLERFENVTPELGWDPTVMAASAVFALGGAWVVSGRAARRVTKVPLAEALRNKHGDRWGSRWSDRVVSRLRVGGLFERLAARNVLRRRARSLSALLQVAAGVGAVIVVASLASSVTAFNSAELEPWRWETRTIAEAPGLPISEAEAAKFGEPAIWTEGEVQDWEVDVHGLVPHTQAVDTAVVSGAWLTGVDEAVVSQGFAKHVDLTVGDTVSVDLATGTAAYEVVGLHRSRGRDIYVSQAQLAKDLGQQGLVNTVYGSSVTPPDVAWPATTTSVAEMSAEDADARTMIVGIFTAIGAIIAGVTVLGLMSLVTVSLHERRYETATLTALGATTTQARRAMFAELAPLGILGAGLGVAAGWFGAQGIIAAFEASSAVDIGTDFAEAAVAPAVAGALVVLALLSAMPAPRARLN